MAIYKRPSSRFWWYSVRDGKGGHIRGSTGTENKEIAESISNAVRSARKRLLPADRLHAVIDALLGASKPESLTLAAVWAEYARHVAKTGKVLAKTTVDKRRLAVTRFAEWAKDHRPACASAEDVDRACASAYAEYLANQGTKGKTRANILSDLGTVWVGLMTMRDGVTANPWKLFVPETNDSERLEAFTQEQETAILKAADNAGNGWGLACRIARYTGLRYGDIAMLTWDRIDLDGGWISLAPSKTARHGIAVRVPIVTQLDAALRAALAHRGLETSFVLPVHARVYPRTHASNGPGLFSQVLESAKLNVRGFTFHSWRHTFRTRLAEAGVSNDLAKRLGGWTEDTTAARYDHAERAAELRAAVMAGAGQT